MSKNTIEKNQTDTVIIEKRYTRKRDTKYVQQTRLFKAISDTVQSFALANITSHT